MIYKYTKCESIIAKIMADANMTEKNFRVTDIREWIFEAVEKIGAPMLYIHKESGEDGVPVFLLIDSQIPMPEDLESLIGVAYSVDPNGPWINVRKNERTFKGRKPGKAHFREIINIGPTYESNNYTVNDVPNQFLVEERIGDKYMHYPEQPARHKKPTTLSQLYTQFNHSSKEVSAFNAIYNETPTYFVKPGWIVLNKNKGFVKLAYKSIATDERGYPLIPDLASYQEAIYWYVMMKLNFPKFLQGQLGGGKVLNFNTYAYLLLQWNFYRNQAYAEAMMPNEGEMMSIKNEWNKILPDFDDDVKLFKDSGEEERIYNDYYYGY